MSVIRRVLIMPIGILIASVVTIFMPAPEAYADNCDFLICGAVKNRTGRIINITAKFGQGQPNLCDVWNWDGGRKVVRCKQETRGNGTFGGIGTGYDVDAFTFANNGYHVRLYRLGAWQWITKGVWTKISSDKIADCGIGDNNEVWCTVLEQ